MNYVQNEDGNYYKFKSNGNLKKITKKEYLSKTSNKISNINKLKNSLYPGQSRDYILLKYPKTFPTDIRNKYIPVDFQLANIIKILWKNKIITLGWDQGSSNKDGFISMECFTTDLKNVIPIIKKLFGPRKIEIFNYIMNPKKELETIKNRRKYDKLEAKKYPKLIRLSVEWYMSISFNNSLIPWMNKKLKTTMPTEESSLRGSRIIQPPNYKIVKK